MAKNQKVMRAYYDAPQADFLHMTNEAILGLLVDAHMPYELTEQQERAWKEEILILKHVMKELGEGHVVFEYTIPRMGKRVDAVVFYKGLVFVLEFKVFESKYPFAAIDQVLDYALDLHNFHEQSHKLNLFPIVVCTEGSSVQNNIKIVDSVASPALCNKENILQTMVQIANTFSNENMICVDNWINSAYKPTPTIIEAAQALYRQHSVADITRNDADDLAVTTDAIKNIITYSKTENRKSIIFVTGVPGAGKTLVGLNLANDLHNNENDEHAVFLSGNHPLVAVLQEALTEDKVSFEKEHGRKISKKDAKREIISFIQMIYHYRDYHFGNDYIPSEKIAIFDESQRAWTKDEMLSFMRKNNKIKSGPGFERDIQYSEPGFLISTMDRHQDWAVIVCLVGGGQEINRGEAGLPEWFDSLNEHFAHWDVYLAPQLEDKEYLRNRTWGEVVKTLNANAVPALHLSATMRSFRSEKVSEFVKMLLDNNAEAATKLYDSFKKDYPICVTRDLSVAKQWVKTAARGSERYGLLASSNATRLKPYGVVYSKDAISPENWFMKGKDDIRSSYYLETVASEFETQGLELDYAVIAWGGDLRIEHGEWRHYNMSTRLMPPNWSPVRSADNITFLTNAYRVLLTRARQGFIIYIPEGEIEDKTRQCHIYDETYRYLKSIGIQEV